MKKLLSILLSIMLTASVMTISPGSVGAATLNEKAHRVFNSVFGFFSF